jgi:Raf kinase inhibitor-like YbhB/YbcL family protein
MLKEQVLERGTINLKSPVFEQGESIPRLYTCDGENHAPPLTWDHAPTKVSSFALVMDDPDAGKTWVHWILFNLPPDRSRIEENTPKQNRLPSGAIQGKNDFGEVGYGGPCPPSGTHRYFFHIYALDKMLDLDSSVTKTGLLKAMQGHILAEGSLMGTYTRE